jgi:predicted transcriptional regulator
LCIGGSDTGDISQKPFEGKTDYDYAFWIDSNTVFTPNDVQSLIDLDKPISSGISASSMIAETLSSDTSQQKMMTSEEFEKKKEPFKVELIGFNFLCLKKGVLESLEYPFFKPHCLNFAKSSDDGKPDKVCRVYTNDETSFCFDMKENGIDIVVHPSVIVGSIIEAIV